jgi:multidrug resistance efflux pump
MVRYQCEAIAKEAAVKQARLEVARAEIILATYAIRSPARGVIKAIYRHPGEAVRKYEAVFAIQLPKEEK